MQYKQKEYLQSHKGSEKYESCFNIVSVDVIYVPCFCVGNSD